MQQDKHLKIFIGLNANYYLRKWSTVELLGPKNTWNWAAFVFSIFWLAYRKMYTYCSLFIFSLLIGTMISLIFMFSIITNLMLGLFFVTILGYFGNNIYRYHCRESLTKIYASNASEKLLVIMFKESGGVNFFAAFILFFILSLLAYLMLVLFNLLPDLYQPENLVRILLN